MRAFLLIILSLVAVACATSVKSARGTEKGAVSVQKTAPSSERSVGEQTKSEGLLVAEKKTPSKPEAGRTEVGDDLDFVADDIATSSARSPKLTSSKESADLKAIQKVVKRYREAPAVKMAVTKMVYTALLEKEDKSKGTLYFSKGRLRMEIADPEPSLLVADGNCIWLETRLPEDFGGQIQVAKLSTQGARKKSNAMLALLFDDEAVWNELIVKRKSKQDGLVKFELEPKKGANLPEVTKVFLILKDQKIQEIAYWDDLDNKTQFHFSNVNLKAKVAKNLFQYRPPKDAEVTEY